MSRIHVFIVMCLALFFLPALEAAAGDVDEHAPIGVMADHFHNPGEWMVSYRYMRMDMPENYSGSDKVSVSEVHDAYMISPTEMSMEMHMVGVMYGITDTVTGMVMLPYLIKDMDHRRRDGAEFNTRTEGIGDVQVSGLFSLREKIDLPVLFQLGVSLPTGSVNQKGDTLAGNDQDLPYPMQLGAGSYGAVLGGTYFDKRDAWTWGVQEKSVFYLAKNEHDYKLGDVHELSGWFGYRWNKELSTSVRVRGLHWKDIRGADPRLNPMMVPTADPNLRGGTRIDALVGFNLMKHGGVLDGHRLAVEVGYPLYQDLNGPQLGTEWQTTLGWQLAW